MATLTSLGIGAIIVPALTVALYACPDRYIGTTAALSLSSRFLGGSVGTAIYFNIFNTKIKSKLPEYVASAAVGANLPAGNAMQFVGALLGPGGGVVAAGSVPGATPMVLQAAGLATRWAYADSLAYGKSFPSFSFPGLNFRSPPDIYLPLKHIRGLSSWPCHFTISLESRNTNLAVDVVWYTTIAFGVISIVCCAFLPNIRRFMTDRVAVVSSNPVA